VGHVACMGKRWVGHVACMGKRWVGHVACMGKRWVGHVACMGMRRHEVQTGFWWGELKDRDHLVDLVIDWKIMLHWILNCGLDWCGLEEGQVVALVTAVMNRGFHKVQGVSCLKNCTYDVAHPLHSPWPDLTTLVTCSWAVQIMNLLMQFLQSSVSLSPYLCIVKSDQVLTRVSLSLECEHGLT